MSQGRQNEKVNAALQALMHDFETGNIADTVAMAVFPMVGNIPSGKWSLLNRGLIFRLRGGLRLDGRDID